MRVKLTDLSIQNFKYQHPQMTYWDTLLPAFGVRVGSRSKTFIVMLGKARKRQTLGRYPELTLQKARDQARLFISGKIAADDAGISLRQALETYLRHCKTRQRTLAEYERLLNRHFVPGLGHRRLSDITARDIIAVTDRLLHTPTECRHAHVAMQSFLNDCVRRQLISASPMAGLKCPTKPNKRERVLTTSELQAIWRASQALGDFGKIVQLCILTGQRRGEISQLQSSFVSSGILTLPAVLTKNKRQHSVPLSATSLKLTDDLPFKTFNWSRAKSELDKLSGVNNWVLHDLRRTFATINAQLGAPPHLIERALNHVTGSGTALQHVYQRYAYEPKIRRMYERYETHLDAKLQCTSLI